MHQALGPTPGPRTDGQPSPEPASSADQGAGAARHVARIARTVGGVLLLVAGVAMLVLPGPGLVVIAAGLALLAVDYAWAKRLLAKARQRIDAAGEAVAGRVRKRRKPR